MNTPEDCERRSYVRVQDTLWIYFNSKPRTLDTSHLEKIQLWRNFQHLEEKLHNQLYHIQSNSPQLYQACHLMNQKINLVIEHTKPHELLGDFTRIDASLSASGISLMSNQSYAIHDKLWLEMILLPSYEHISTHCDVISCEPQVESQSEQSAVYCLRLEFQSIDEATQEILIQHVIRRESQLLCEARLQREANELK